MILDSSIYGMGRGAGNLNTELFVEYLNENAGKTYQVKPLLTIVDEILNGFYQQNYWGYSLPNYLSAAYRTHPNYASYLDDKKTLTVESMAELFALMEESKRYEFDKAYIEELYLRYMAAEQVHDMRRMDLKEKLKGKKVLLVAPGRSSYDEKDKIIKFSKQEDVITISINMEYQYADTDFIFLSNMRRLRELKSDVYPKCIVTSNISADGVYLKTCYGDLVNKEVAVKDNAGMMAIKFMMQMGVENIYLAGFDGYSHDAKENYADDYVAYVTRNAILDEMNTGMGKVLADFMKQAHISFLTEQKYLKIDKGE